MVWNACLHMEIVLLRHIQQNKLAFCMQLNKLVLPKAKREFKRLQGMTGTETVISSSH